jgi:hypothetical protein
MRVKIEDLKFTNDELLRMLKWSRMTISECEKKIFKSRKLEDVPAYWDSALVLDIVEAARHFKNLLRDIYPKKEGEQ